MAGFLSYLENAIEQMDEKAAEIAHDTSRSGTSSSALPPPPAMVLPEAMDEDVVKMREELEQQKRTAEVKRLHTQQHQQQQPPPPPRPSSRSSRGDTPSPPPEQTTTTTTTPAEPTPTEAEDTPEEAKAAPSAPSSRSVSVVSASPPLPDVRDEEIQLLRKELSVVDKEKQSLQKRGALLENLLGETQDRMHSQITAMLGEKEQLEREYAEAAQQREDVSKQVEVNNAEFLEQLQQRDAVITELRAGKNEYFEKKDENAERVADLEAKNADLTEELSSAKGQTSALVERVEKYEVELSEVQRDMDNKEEDIRQTQAMLQVRQQDVHTSTQELEQYKARVSRMLLEKDKQIQDLQQNRPAEVQAASAPISVGDATEKDARIVQLELDLERSVLEHRTALSEKNSSVAALKSEVADLKSLLENYRSTSEGQQGSLAAMQRQLFDSQQDIVTTRTRLEDDVRKKELLIQKLEKKLNQKATDDSQTELSQRCRHLTESLMEKQAILETKTLELQQSSMRVTTLQQNLRDMERLAPTPAAPQTETTRRGGNVVTDLESQMSYEVTPYQVCVNNVSLSSRIFNLEIKKSLAFGRLCVQNPSSGR